MLDAKFIRENFEAVKENAKRKKEKTDINEFPILDEKRRELIAEVQALKAKKNETSKLIGKLKKEGKDAESELKAMKDLAEKIKSMDEELNLVEKEIKDLLLRVPNMLSPDVPVGETEADNVVVRSWGEPKDSAPEHTEIGSKLGILNFEKAAKIAGSGFASYYGKGAALERALINFMLDFNVEENGYTEAIIPFLANRKSMTNTGQIPKLEDDMYKIENEDYYLIPTAEVSLTNYFAGEVLKKDDLPVKICGYSPCFRREAGSYGKETKGLQRLHQFNKVELVKIAEPEKSYDELESLVGDVEKILKALEIPYRVVLLNSSDTSFASAKTYDLEVWAPGEGKWLEVSSCSNFEAFQARRLGLKYKPDAKSKPIFAHTLNGSGLATPRLMIALLENYWNDGAIKIPEVLADYCGFKVIN